MKLTEVIYKKTLGNIIFHSIEVLEELQQKKLLAFSRKRLKWEWDLDDKALKDLLSENVIEAVMGKIFDTHPDLQPVLVLAAYTRSVIDVETLSELTVINGRWISPEELLFPTPGKAVSDGLLVNTFGSLTYAFCHDRIQEAGE